MRYYSAKGIVFVILMGFMIAMIVVSVWAKGYFILPVLLPVLAYLLWMWFDTYYVVEKDEFFYKSALLKGSIKIDSITEIVKNKTQFSGIKASISTKGLIIKYNRWDDVYISPKDQQLFIDKLKAINPGIQITG